MKPAPHTPVNFLKAGGMGGFSAKCIALLAEAGLEPDDFGTYEHVQSRIYAARQRVKQAKSDGVDPDPHDAFLAQCQAGHATQSTLMAGDRENACTNHSPPPADSRGYHDELAPCFPTPNHTTVDPRGSRRGSNHWAVGNNEARQNDGNEGEVVGEQELSRRAVENGNIATQSPNEGQYQRDLQGLQDQRDAIDATAAQRQAEIDSGQSRLRKARTKAMRDAKRHAGEGLTRAEALDDLRKASAESVDQPDTEGGTLDGNSAGECIDAWRKQAMVEMKKKVEEKYGDNYDQTVADTQAERDAAAADAQVLNDAIDRQRPDETPEQCEQRRADARGEAMEITRRRLEETANDPNADPIHRQQAQQQLDDGNMYGAMFTQRSRANQTVEHCDNELRNAECLHQQVTAGDFDVNSQPTGIVPDND